MSANRNAPRRRNLVAPSAIIFTFLSTFFLGGCGSPPEAPGSSQVDDSMRVLRRGNGGEPQSLDPALAEDVHAFNILADLYEGLVLESADGTLLPGVAERWDISADGRRYDFFLRDDAVWSTGEPVTAQDFVAGFHRVLSPGSTSAYAFLLEPILNYQAVLDGELPMDSLGVSAVDDGSLVINLSSPAPHFLGVLAMPVAFPAYSRNSDDALRFRDASRFVGNGPFVLEQWSVSEKIRLKKNPLYRNASAVEIDAVEYLPVTDPRTELNMYRAGELDITNSVPPDAIEALRGARPEELRIAPSLGLYYLAFDLSEPPLDNLFLRKALTMAIDRRTLVSLLGRGEQEAYGIVPRGVLNHRHAYPGWFDLSATERENQARAVFAQAGYGAGKPLRLKLTYDVGDIHETVALAVASMWREVLGVEVALEKKEWKFFLATRDDRPAWQVMRFAWAGDYNDASTFTDIFRRDSPQNLPGYRSESYDLLLDQAREATDPDIRASRLQAAEALLTNDYPISPLYFFVSKHLVSERVLNYQNNVLDRHPTQFLKLKAAN